ncbi:ABC transporter ATP-binding protein/permease [Pseudomonas indica]|uniref:Putative ATP-binding cassette transporter n=1 Tax=Pseudomonas indica TaxID=137658 RepID=A0A1G9A1V5_9PSED|nr:ABC transporter ATP-binding protein/permease [Pseudomonas indica]MBU3057959.1 ABC transporter ATP-binding protein/permease [Pseudomonas indica]PAU59153.1 ABC transporter ATP-binding protein [Pseudomonas indica]SDK21241.1 putative ATP-binding cassette transporter [Pseudomonas indica]
MQTLRDFWSLARPFWSSSERRPALLLLFGTILMNLCLVGVNILYNLWNLHFYNALQALDYDAFLMGGGYFILLQAGLATFTVAAFHFQQKLTLRWRRWSTENTLQLWLQRQRYLKLQLTSPETDNPDQRIADDINLFIGMSLKLSLGLMTALVSLFSFLHILWQASSLVRIPIAGEELVIPGLLVWAALLYSILGTGGAFWLGRTLPRLNFLQQRREADFRFSLMRLRENAEAVAQYRGESEEHARFSQRLGAALENFWALVKQQKVVLGYSTFYMRSAMIIPMFVMAPQFFAGAFPLGRLTQLSAAFGEVHEAMAYLVKVFPEIAEWKSIIDRLTGFQQRLASVGDETGVRLEHDADGFEVQDLSLWLPDGKPLLSGLNLYLQPGESLLIQAPSGYGKSTLIRALTGIWSHASGKARYDLGNVLTLAQKPYLPLGSLRDMLWYPATPRPEDDPALQRIMRQFGLGHLIEQLDAELDWSQTLSIGEQQRCAFARALLMRPKVLLLDETSSALDEATERTCYTQLKQSLPHSIIISVGHRASLELLHTRTLNLQHCRLPEPKLDYS